MSRGCIIDPDKLHFYCNFGRNAQQKRQTTGQFNIECCAGDYCNNGSFPELPPLPTDDQDATRLDFSNLTQNYVLLFAVILVFAMVVVSIIVLAVYVLLRRTKHKRLLMSHRKQDPNTYYASDDILRATSAGDSTLRVSSEANFVPFRIE